MPYSIKKFLRYAVLILLSCFKIATAGENFNGKNNITAITANLSAEKKEDVETFGNIHGQELESLAQVSPTIRQLIERVKKK